MADRARSPFITLKSKIQRTKYDEDDFHFVNKRFKREGDLDNILDGVTALVAILHCKNERKPKSKDKLRDAEKLWLVDAYRNWSEEDFEAKMRINHTAFNFVLDEIYEDIILAPANLKPNPTSPDQYALTIYRLAASCTYSTLSDLFGVSVSAASKFFNKLCRLMVVSLYDRYVRLTTTDEEWQNEICGILENCEFPCVGAWDGFLVYINSQLKIIFNFQKKILYDESWLNWLQQTFSLRSCECTWKYP